MKLETVYTSYGNRKSKLKSALGTAASEWHDPNFEYDEDVEPTVAPKVKTGFRIFDLKPPYPAPSLSKLPKRDAFGWPHGDEYTPLLKARTPSMSTRAVMPGFKLERLHQALSTAELRVLTKLAFHPGILDFREQYGIVDEKAFWRAELTGKRMQRSKLMTIDVIVTYFCPRELKLKYHAISVKARGYIPDEKDLRREERERKAMEERGWTWELIIGDEVSMVEFGNLQLLMGFAVHHHLPSLYSVAESFAKVVIRCSNRGSLDAVLLRVARNIGISLDDAYVRFSASVAYGFLAIDHRYDLRPANRLELIRTGRHAIPES
ncbi:TnsA endonuclease N-terminal domain-containing protein [Paraburkholderia ginsengisoli]|uniref:TnsA endonuclease N-terminal domain-containing protein n=1 Tax=Paraburkholderia ginsengisoli TaxID=311231 RepID=A0A7T4N0X5_9BURK|nr:TnsA endonuclease N-terminal domain-containing protein [Paraburkholderia ginsengisoli]QQC63189.1 TnsA endonuclease N-terminal domain-containing protein [Paraburkholderia ginsengisoli]